MKAVIKCNNYNLILADMNSLSGHTKKYKKYDIQIYDTTSRKTFVRNVYPWLKIKSLKDELNNTIGLNAMKLYYMNSEMENEKYLDDYIILTNKESTCIISPCIANQA